MNPEILSQLKDVHLPQNPSWWPLAVGYYILVTFFILIIGLLIFYIRKRKPIWALRKQLNFELKLIEEKYLQDNNISALQNNLVSLIKRICRSTNKNTELNLTACAEKIFKKSLETTEFVELLERDRFRKIASISPTRLLELAKKKFKKCTL